MSVLEYVPAPKFGSLVEVEEVAPRLASLREPKIAFRERHSNVVILQWTVEAQVSESHHMKCAVLAGPQLMTAPNGGGTISGTFEARDRSGRKRYLSRRYCGAYDFLSSACHRIIHSQSTD